MPIKLKQNVLLIIDMQPTNNGGYVGFKTAENPSTVRQCSILIREAKENKDLIVILEYRDEGPTHHCLKRSIGTYRRTVTILKNYNDGSKEFMIEMKARKVNIGHIKVCGVNIGACVQQTVLPLVKKGYDISVIRKACNCSSTWKNPEAWRGYQGADKNLVLVPAI